MSFHVQTVTEVWDKQMNQLHLWCAVLTKAAQWYIHLKRPIQHPHVRPTAFSKPMPLVFYVCLQRASLVLPVIHLCFILSP